jgi:hypothetical protein
MGRIRNTITVTCFVVFTIIASLAALQTLRAGLPETPTSTGASILISHLADVDMEGYIRRSKRHEARRVMREMRDDVDWQADVAALSEAQQKQLIDNLTVLAQEVIEQKMDNYFNFHDERDKRRYLNQQIEDVMRWAVLLDRATRKPGENSVAFTAITTLMGRLNKWFNEADPEQRQRLQLFQKAFQEQMTERFKRGMQPGR